MDRVKYLLFMILALGLVINGCKKGTKLEPAVEKPPVAEKKVEQPPAPPEAPKPVEQPQVTKKEVTFQPIYFDFDKYNLRSDAVEGLNQNAKALMENPDTRIRIEGNCDERGTVEYNLALGEKRAMAGKDYLVKLGVSASRIDVISYGKEKPLDPGHNEAAWSKNRRDDFKVITQ